MRPYIDGLIDRANHQISYKITGSYDEDFYYEELYNASEIITYYENGKFVILTLAKDGDHKTIQFEFRLQSEKEFRQWLLNYSELMFNEADGLIEVEYDEELREYVRKHGLNYNHR